MIIGKQEKSRMVKENGDTEELIENWTLGQKELELIRKKVSRNRLIFAVLFKHFQIYGRFPEKESSISEIIISYVANQLKVFEKLNERYDWQGHETKVYRREIRRIFKFRLASIKDTEEMIEWLKKEILPNEQKFELLLENLYERWKELRIEPPTVGRIERLIRGASSQYEQKICEETLTKLSKEAKAKIDMLLNIEDVENEIEEEIEKQKRADFIFLKTDPGAVGLESFLSEIKKLKQIREIGLPSNLWEGISGKLIKTYRHRAATTTTYQLKQHPEYIRYTLMAAFCMERAQEITDNLIELLMTIIKRLSTRAERRINKELVSEIQEVSGKTNILFRIAEVAVEMPEGVIEQVIYPVVSQKTLKDLVEEYKAIGIAYRQRIHKVIRSSFARHYRRMIPELLEELEFRSNNNIHQPLIKALELLKKYSSSKSRYYEAQEEIPIDGVLKSGWREIILETDGTGKERINRINYEISVLQALRERLNCKEIWVVGANRYGNPDNDLPKDFEEKRQIYYEALKLPEDVETFITNLQKEMTEGLETLETGMPKNKDVNIIQNQKGESLIKVSPFEKVAEPINLRRLKTEINENWHQTSLLDILKETDLRVDFTSNFKSMGTREMIEKETLQKRLLLCLYGMGTNTGLKKINTGINSENYHDLVYVHRRFIHKEQLHNAIGDVVNAIFDIRSGNVK
jgi:hypothetical protein